MKELLALPLSGLKNPEKVQHIQAYLEEKEVPRICYPVWGQESGEVDDYYFKDYHDEQGRLLPGITFSSTSLGKMHPKYQEDSWGALYLMERTNISFTLGLIEPKENGGRTFKSIEYNLSEGKFILRHLLVPVKTSFTNVEKFFANLQGRFGLADLLFMVSPPKYPRFYLDMYKALAVRGGEYVSYIGRFLNRLATFPLLEVIYKSGLPRDMVTQLARSIVTYEKYPTWLDDTQTSVRLMFRMDKPTWKLATQRVLSYDMIRGYAQEEQRLQIHKEYIQKWSDVLKEQDPLTLAEELLKLEAEDFEDYLKQELPKLGTGCQVYKFYKARSYYLPQPLFPEWVKAQEKSNLQNLNPKVREYYLLKWAEEFAKTQREDLQSRKDKVNTSLENKKLFHQILDITKELNRYYRVNHTRGVITGEGVILQGTDAPVGSVIALHRIYNLDIRRLVDYMYYEVPLTQGYNILASNWYTEDNYDNASFTRTHDKTYHDYLHMSSRFGGDFERYPKYLKTAHDIAVANYKILKDDASQKNLDLANLDAKLYETVKVPKSSYFIRVLRTVEEFVREGNEMGNCVASYLSAVIAGDKQVLVMRHKDHPEKALIDIEVVNGAIVQVEQRFAVPPSPEHKEFIERFAHKVGLDIHTWQKRRR